jgi:hypothetical protein
MTNLAKTSKSVLASLALAAGLGLGASSAQAGGSDVFWSIAMSQPGIHIGVGNMPAPVVVHAPRHVVVHPRPVYVPPRVIYVAPHHHGHAHGHWKDRHDHHGRWNDHRGGHGRGHEHQAHRGGGRNGPEMHMGNRR